VAIPEEHAHLLDLRTDALVCACRACALLGSRFRPVPARVRSLPGLRISDEQWEALQVPVGLAFFTRSTRRGRVVARYPSPAGPTESQLDLAAWAELEAANPGLREIEPDVEALLVNRVGTAGDSLVVSIDRCYELVALVRMHWRGLSGSGCTGGASPGGPRSGAPSPSTSTACAPRRRRAPMPELEFTVEGAAAVPFCAAPTLGVDLRVTNARGDYVHAVALDCQVRIDAPRRLYGDGERDALVGLFGERERWSQTLRSLLWTHAHVSVPPFFAETRVQLPVPCTADLEVLAGRYFRALDGGAVPIGLLFSGTVFYAGESGALTVARIPWSAEARFDLPVSTWRELLDRYFPNTAWLTLRRDVYDRLTAYRDERGLPSLEQALEDLLDGAAHPGVAS
jgi:hypothetical protein